MAEDDPLKEIPESIFADDDGSADARLAEYQPYWAARADLLERLGDAPAAAQAYEREQDEPPPATRVAGRVVGDREGNDGAR